MKRIIPFVLLFALLSACSKGDGVDDLIPVYDPDCYPHQNDSTKQEEPTVTTISKFSYMGTWMVDGVKCDTAEVSLTIKNHTEFSVAFSNFPYKAIMAKFLPEIKYTKITANLGLAGYISDEEAFFNKIVYYKLGLWECINGGIPYRFLGKSDKISYLEVKAGEESGKRFIPFVVTMESGELMAVVLTIAPTESPTVFELGGTLSIVLTITHIETIENGDVESIVNGVSQIKKLESAMQVKLTTFTRTN